jgi:hypothetical protein
MGLDMHSITMSSFGGDHAALHKAVFLSDNKSASAFFFFSQRQYLTISPLETVRQHLLKKKKVREQTLPILSSDHCKPPPASINLNSLN